MRQSSRLQGPYHGAGGGPARGPVTPRRSVEALDELIRQLEADCHLGLQVRGKNWTPTKTDRSLADRVQGQIKHCFYISEPVLRQSLDNFKNNSESLRQEEKLQLLHLQLRSILKPRDSPSGTLSQTPRDDTHKSLLSQPSASITGSPQTFRILRDDEPESLYTTAPESASPTDDEGEWVGPPSPSASIKSISKQGRTNTRVSFGLKGIGKKRPSQSSDDGGISPKPAKISKAKLPYEAEPSPASARLQGVQRSLFKKPSLNMAPSHQPTSAQTSFNTSMSTSFNSTTRWSSQETFAEPDTAATSFNVDLAHLDISSPKLTRTSSTTIGSLEDQDLYEVILPEEERTNQSDVATRESSSTYGSIDEDAMVQISSSFGPATSRAVQLQREPQNIPTIHESPTKMSHHIRDIPRQNLFVDDITEDLKQLPYFVLFISLRISIENNIPLQELIGGIDEGLVQSNPEFLWAKIRSHPRIPASFKGRESKKLWLAVPKNLDGYTFKGKVAMNSKESTPVFSIQLLPLLEEKSCRFQRAFGSDRFLYLVFPSLEPGSRSKPARFTNNDLKQIRTRWLEWFRTEHTFLGRKWRAFHAEPLRGKKKSSLHKDDMNGTRVILFATEGLHISKPCAIRDMLNWFFPFRENEDQTFCKAYARLDLGLSRTVPTLVFKPSQIVWVDDIVADGTPEDQRFNDETLLWEDIEGQPVMNDGCALVSLGAAQEIWKLYKSATGINETMPTAFQARIGGSKGLWFVSSETFSGTPPIWIQISTSQLKFKPHPQDGFDEKYDPLRLTFELVAHSSSPKPSDLHLSFIPIMVDRGVTKEALEKVMLRRLDTEREQLLNMLGDPVRMYDWVTKNGGGARDTTQMLWQAALPLALGDRIRLLLEKGFHPKEEPYLGNSLCRLVRRHLLWEEEKLRVPLGKSTFLFGIADPLGVLAPGEIHVRFSTWFYDEASESRYLGLDDMDVLVARLPACRRSDLQKVRAISHHKLGHLVDVVVFPTRGQYPLAGKLQGGDYDGDTFWICWEADLVEPFKNAPAPTLALDPSRYGITQYKTKLREIETVDRFLEEAVAFRISPSLLGKVTNFFDKQAYAENRVFSRTLDALCDMHDLLVDAPKQGYSFTDREFNSALLKLGINVPKNPAYKEAMEACANAKEMGEADKVRSMPWSYNEQNVVDFLYFCVLRKHNLETQRKVEEMLSKTSGDDPALQYPYLYEHSKGHSTIEFELRQLAKSFESIYGEWNKGMTKNGGNTDADNYNLTVDKCYEMFRALMPTPENAHVPEIKSWTEQSLWPNVMNWHYLRASAVYNMYPHKPAFVFHLAGEELADLKSPPSRTTRRVCGPIFSILKPKMTRETRYLRESGRSEDDDDDDDEEEEEDEFRTPLEDFPDT